MATVKHQMELLAQGYRDMHEPSSDTAKFARRGHSVQCYWNGCESTATTKVSKSAGLFFFCDSHVHGGKPSWTSLQKAGV